MCVFRHRNCFVICVVICRTADQNRFVRKKTKRNMNKMTIYWWQQSVRCEPNQIDESKLALSSSSHCFSCISHSLALIFVGLCAWKINFSAFCSRQCRISQTFALASFPVYHSSNSQSSLPFHYFLLAVANLLDSWAQIVHIHLSWKEHKNQNEEEDDDDDDDADEKQHTQMTQISEGLGRRDH